jgi:ribonuclease HI
MKIKVYTDGATVGHNGKLGTVKEVGLGIYVEILGLKTENSYKDISVKKTEEIKMEISEKVKGGSNNEAEFKALISGLTWLAVFFERREYLNGRDQYKGVPIEFFSDSEIIVNRMKGRRPLGRYKNERMDKFQDEAFEIIEENLKDNPITFNWIPREKNEIADRLSKEACKLNLK